MHLVCEEELSREEVGREQQSVPSFELLVNSAVLILLAETLTDLQDELLGGVIRLNADVFIEEAHCEDLVFEVLQRLKRVLLNL